MKRYSALRPAVILATLAAAGLATPVLATDGYFAHGYGMTAKGMGGAATAMTKDSFGGANNPASMVWVGNRLDAGLDWFSPERSASRRGSAGGFGFFDGSVDSDKTSFYIPEFGYNRMLNERMSVGLTIYGNGGMNTDYSPGQVDSGVCTTGIPNGIRGANMLCGSTRLGVDLIQLIVAPTFAMKLNQDHSIGIAPLFGYQKFAVDGLQAFGQISSDPARLTNQGDDDSTGWGLRIGWQGRLSDSVTVGAAYATKMHMSAFDSYRGLFAEQGGFDMPENWSIGIAFKATPKLTIAADYQAINYGGVPAIANSSQTLGCAPTPPGGPGVGSGCLGGASGIGFGWQDIGVFKIGGEYQYNDRLTLRAGYNHSENPIESRDVTFNILAPGVVEDHLSLGFTYSLNKELDMTMQYTHAFEESVSGTPNAVYFPVGGREEIKMYQNSLGIAFGWKM